MLCIARGMIVVFIALACGLAAGAKSESERTGSQQIGEIIVQSNSNVCVSVDVDERIWPRQLDAETTKTFSGNLAAALRNLYLDRGGSYSFSGEGGGSRFTINPHGANPYCQDEGTDVLIEVQYGPRPDGTPFAVEYSIHQGGNVRSDTIDVDLAEEIKLGRIEGYSQRRDASRTIAEDIPRRAPMLFEQLSVASPAMMPGQKIRGQGKSGDSIPN